MDCNNFLSNDSRMLKIGLHSLGTISNRKMLFSFEFYFDLIETLLEMCHGYTNKLWAFPQTAQ